MTVFMSMILILRRFTEMGLHSIFLILVLRRFTEMGLLSIFQPITWSNELVFRYGIPFWACGMILLLSALKY